MERHFTASMVVFDAWAGVYGRVLLVHHRGSGKWQFPGGHVDPNEAPHDAAIREVKEETGIDVFVTSDGVHSVSGVTTLPRPMLIAEMPAAVWPERPGVPTEAPHLHVDFLYLGKSIGDATLKHAEDELHGAQWFNVEDLLARPPRVTEDIRADVFDVLRHHF